MVQDYFDTPVAYNPDADQLVAGASFQVYAATDAELSAPLTPLDAVSGTPIANLRSSSIGVLPAFRVAGDPAQVILRSGTFTTRLTSKYGIFLEVVPDPDQLLAAIAAGDRAEAALAEIPTVIAAADIPGQVEAQVDEAFTTRLILEGAAIVEPDISFSVVDEDGRRLWLEAGPDGGPTEYAASKIASAVAVPVAAEVGIEDMNTTATGLSVAIVDEDDARTWLEADANGGPTPRALALIGAGLDIASELPVPPTSSTDLVLIGHSMLAQASSYIASAMPTRTTSSLAVGGESMSTISARWGSHPTRIRPVGGEVPASGAVTITLNADALTPLLQGPATYAVTLVLDDGTLVPGTFGRSGADFSFTRTTPGSAIAIARPVLMRYDVSDQCRSRTAVFWAGRNGAWATSGLEVRERLDRMEGMIRHLRALDRRFVVLSEHIQSATVDYPTSDNTATANAIAEYNRQAYLRWGDRFIDTQAYLIEFGLADRGISPTADDTADIAIGRVPRSLRSDALHLNANGSSVVAALIRRRLTEKGW